MPFLRLPWILSCLLLLAGALRGAETRPDREVFGLTNLWEIHLTITPEDWHELGAKASQRSQSGGFNFFGGRPKGGPRRREDYTWANCTVTAGGQTWTNVSIRFKGNSSFVRAPNGLKRPFRLDFDRGAPGRTFFGQEELVLNNNVNDPTQMHEALAYDLFRQAGLPAPRTAFAQVTLNIPGQVERQPLGLYTLVEPVSRDFLKRHFGSSAGLLVKPEMMPGLAYLGDDWSAYVERYGPKGKVEPDGARRLIDFTRFIGSAEPEAYGKELAEYLDPEPFLRFVALNALLANLDSFIGNGHNYYLFIDARTRRAHFIPWDLNEAFGAHPVSGPSADQMTFSVLRPNADPNLLVERTLQDPRLGPAYRRQLATLLTNVFEPGRLGREVDRLAAVTRPVVDRETSRAKADFRRTVLGQRLPIDDTLDYPRHDPEVGPGGYQPWGFPGSVWIDDLPLKAWIAGRHAHAQGQLDGKVRGSRPRARMN